MVAIAGFFTALFILPILRNIKIAQISYIVLLLVVALPLLWMLALLVGRFLSRWIGWMYQFAKFCIVGFLNAAIDFGILNLISLFTGITQGFIIGGVNIPGFMVAATNSYFWNKFWVFSHRRKEGEPINYKDAPTFILVVASGALLNSGIVIFVSTYIPALFDLSGAQWLNISKVIAAAIALAWNFVGFKIFVFKKADADNISVQANSNPELK